MRDEFLLVLVKCFWIQEHVRVKDIEWIAVQLTQLVTNHMLQFCFAVQQGNISRAIFPNNKKHICNSN